MAGIDPGYRRLNAHRAWAMLGRIARKGCLSSILPMSLLTDAPAETPARPGLGAYLLPGLILLNLLLAASLAGWLPTVFGDRQDPARLARQVDPGRVKVLPAAASSGTAAHGARGAQDGAQPAAR